MALASSRQAVGKSLRRAGSVLIDVAPEHAANWNRNGNSNMDRAIVVTGELMTRLGNKIMPRFEADEQ